MTNHDLARGLRVREKLLLCGAQSLADIELLAAFISSGSPKKSCMTLAQDLLTHLGDLRSLLNCDLHAFKQIAGLGMVRYVQLQAAKEMCRRSDFISLQKNFALTNSNQTYAYLKRQLRDKKNETFAALFLDSQHRIITYEELFTGTINSATIHPRPIIERTLQLNAAALILAHNHPSGLSDASDYDLAVTAKLQCALELIDTRLLDHIVVGDNEIYSIMNAMKWTCH
ncbi:JAB domain-containing protein [Legionella septentrionalis]|uniref:JAB domain-containing protein n=2 Tax=Legionellaceae TaxID=444 RepID=A0A3S0VMJ3_9GAMM|nr:MULTISPECIES: DNA repair protein RadC [Legionella]MCP0913662.1 DNA repair protein RadC [Legionella sp. 27cVA30]RUQ84443.1 JAB domain-containing protein [Legionella septentrionalis]RUQ94655.1 JAB domain-containing protein [Legionella septentrionalis]RUR09246.1 JAB domain-containing protein [Legionella septentrionalis]RUR14486.1 JAB domain-containing protein [Legionella septentrionalis]